MLIDILVIHKHMQIRIAHAVDSIARMLQIYYRVRVLYKGDFSESSCRLASCRGHQLESPSTLSPVYFMHLGAPVPVLTSERT